MHPSSGMRWLARASSLERPSIGAWSARYRQIAAPCRSRRADAILSRVRHVAATTRATLQRMVDVIAGRALVLAVRADRRFCWS